MEDPQRRAAGGGIVGRNLTPPGPPLLTYVQERGEQDPNQTLPPLLTGALSRQERGDGGGEVSGEIQE